MEGDRNMESYFMDYHCSCCKHIVMVNGMETEGRKIGNEKKCRIHDCEN